MQSDYQNAVLQQLNGTFFGERLCGFRSLALTPMLETLALEINTIQNALNTHKALLYNKDLLLNSMKSMKNLQLTSNGFVSAPLFFC